MAEWKKIIVSGSQAELDKLNVDGAVIASSFTGSLQGNATNVTGTVAIANGGTGATTASGARTNLGLGNSATQNTGSMVVLNADTADSTTNATNALNVAVADDSTNAARHIMLSDVTSGNARAKIAIDDLTFNPSTNRLTVNSNGSFVLGNTSIASNTATFGGNVTVGGNLTVSGTTTVINTNNVQIEDRFLFLNAGSGSVAAEGGLIVEGATAGSGSAFFYDSATTRWTIADSIAKDTLAATPDGYVPVVYDVTGASHTASAKVGNIKIENADIYIYV